MLPKVWRALPRVQRRMRGRPGFLSCLTKVSLVCTYMIARKSIKTSLYWAMKNCGGDAEYLRQLIMNISKVCHMIIVKYSIVVLTLQGSTCKLPPIFVLSPSRVQSQQADPHWSSKPSRTLYVGSISTDMRSRTAEYVESLFWSVFI